MPKKTFFRLPQEKQHRLLEAAKVEFSRVSLQEASVANIVRLAEIPRGSFYQYFEDKEDLYYYYFDTLRSSGKKDFEKLLEKENGDIFIAFDHYFTKMLEDVLRGPNAPFYKNLFMYMDYHGTHRVSPEIVQQEERLMTGRKCEREKHINQTHSLINLIDTSILKIDTSIEIIMLIKLLFSMLFATINHAYKREQRGDEVDIEQIKSEFSTKLKWLKYGVYTEKEKVRKDK